MSGAAWLAQLVPYQRPSLPWDLGALFKTLFRAVLCIAAHLRKSRDTPQPVVKEQRLSWKNLRLPTKEFSNPGEPLRYYRTTGLIFTQMQELVRRVNDVLDAPWDKPTRQPRSPSGCTRRSKQLACTCDRMPRRN